MWRQLLDGSEMCRLVQQTGQVRAACSSQVCRLPGKPGKLLWVRPAMS